MSKATTQQSGNSSKSDDAMVTNRMRESAHEYVDRAADSAKGFEHRVRDGSAAAGESFEKNKERINAELKARYSGAETWAKENPLLTLGIAFTAGAVIGRLLKR